MQSNRAWYFFQSFLFTFFILGDLGDRHAAKALFRHGVVPRAAEGVTAADARHGQNRPREEPTRPISLERIGRAGWGEPAAFRLQG